MADTPSRRDVRETFDVIADHFAETRHHPWPEVEDFLTLSEDVERGLDVGCGNGRHSELLADVAESVFALDASRPLLDTARDRLADYDSVTLLQGDAVRLPFADDSIDLALYVATIHHIPRRPVRVASFGELARVLAPDGRALVSTWSTAHERFDRNADADVGFDTDVEWTLPDGETVDRFHHIYAPAEFRGDLRSARLVVQSFRVSSGNCYAVVEPEGKRP